MGWTEAGFISTSRDWAFTPPLAGSEFRIRHFLSAWPLPFGFRGLIAQADISRSQVELFEIRRLYPAIEHQVIRFEAPAAFGDRAIAIRGQRRYYAAANWQVAIDVWV